MTLEDLPEYLVGQQEELIEVLQWGEVVAVVPVQGLPVLSSSTALAAVGDLVYQLAGHPAAARQTNHTCHETKVLKNKFSSTDFFCPPKEENLLIFEILFSNGQWSLLIPAAIKEAQDSNAEPHTDALPMHYNIAKNLAMIFQNSWASFGRSKEMAWPQSGKIPPNEWQ